MKHDCDFIKLASLKVVVIFTNFESPSLTEYVDSRLWQAQSRAERN